MVSHRKGGSKKGGATRAKRQRGDGGKNTKGRTSGQKKKKGKRKRKETGTPGGEKGNKDIGGAGAKDINEKNETKGKGGGGRR